MAKNFLLILMFTFSVLYVKSQGLENIVTEIYYMADSVDIADTSGGNLDYGSVTYRIYADMRPGYKFIRAFGVNDTLNSIFHTLKIETSAVFFNNRLGSYASNNINDSVLPLNTVMIDSWLSSGSASSGKTGILKIYDDSLNTITNTDSLLQSTDPMAGISLKQRDGLSGALPALFDHMGIDTTIFSYDSVYHSGFIIINGYWGNQSGSTGPDTNNMVLMAQLTTSGQLSYQLNIEIEDTSGQVERFVAYNPVNEEIQFPALVYPPVYGCKSKTACNHDSLVTIDDGSCLEPVANCTTCNGEVLEPIDSDGDGVCDANEIYGCTNPGACNYDTLATEDNGMCLEPVANCSYCNGGSLIIIDSDGDGICNEIDPVVNGCASDFNGDGEVNSADLGLLVGMYGMSCFGCPMDINRDGIVDAADLGFLIGQYNDTLALIDTDRDGICDAMEIPGCMSSSACNFNPLATDDNGSCLEPVTNCTVCSGDSLALIDSDRDGICDAMEIPGCMSSSACNYNPLATDDNGSCLEPVTNCTICSGDSLVLVDTDGDGICNANEIPGCMSITACNYDTLATDDDGSCFEPIENCLICNSDTLQLADSDNDGVCDADDPHPFALPYYIKNDFITCKQDEFYISFNALDSIAGCNKVDVSISYDADKVLPTGILNLGNDLTYPGSVEYTYENDNIYHILNISVEVSVDALPGTKISGSGELFNTGFLRNTNFMVTDTALFRVTSLTERCNNSTLVKEAGPGLIISSRDTTLNGELKFRNYIFPLSYDSLYPDNYLVTDVYGTGTFCDNVSPRVTHPDLNGRFYYKVSKEENLNIERDIADTADVMSLINGADALLALKVVLKDTTFKPDIYQILAMDVNMDGVVSSGDITQINQRTVLQRGSFDQSPGKYMENTKDWVFINKNDALYNPRYKISASYPGPDGKGYSNRKVPVPGLCMPLPVHDGCSYPDVTYQGIMLGDVNGSYSQYQHDGILKNKQVAGTNQGIVIDMAHIDYISNSAIIPVYAVSDSVISSIDFSLKFNSRYLTFDNIENTTDKAELIFNCVENKIMLTSYSLHSFEKDKPLFFMSFLTNEHSVESEDIYSVKPYINGLPTGYQFNYNELSAIDNGYWQQFLVYPNPATDNINIISSGNSIIEITDINGKILINAGYNIPGDVLKINTSNFSNGLYYIKMQGNTTFQVKKIVVNK